MQATLWTKANMKVLLDKDMNIIGYQIDESSLKILKILVPEYPYPNGTKKTLILPDIYIKLVYEKEKIENEFANLVSFELNDSLSIFYDKITFNIKEAVSIQTDENMIDDDGSTCSGFSPTSEIYEHTYLCVNCENKRYCIPQC